MKFLLGPIAGFVLLLLAGCASSSPATRVLSQIFSSQSDPVAAFIAAGKLPTDVTYLHVTVGQQPPALLALGFVDPSPSGAVLSWYSGAGEVFKTVNGFLAGMAGVDGAPSVIRYDVAPHWSERDQPVRWRREWDVPRHYKFGRFEWVTITPASSGEIPAVVRQHLVNRLMVSPLNPTYENWRWYQQVGTATGTSWLAVTPVRGSHQLVYSYQCLPSGVCIHVAPWPLAGVVLQ